MATSNRSYINGRLPATETINAAKTRVTSNSIVQFPSDIGDYKMMLTFKPYSYNSPMTQVSNVANIDWDSAKAQPLARNTIVLPLPTNLQDQNEARLSRFDGNYIGDKIAQASQNISNSGGKNFGDAVVDSVKKAFSTGFGKSAADMVWDNNSWDKLLEDSQYLSKFAGQNFARAVSVGAGVVSNPKAALSYEGHELKNHSFVWTFAPRSEEESITLKNILNYIKYCQLPTVGGNNERGMYLKYPMIVDIRLQGLDQHFFYRFKPCMIRSFNVNYAGQNAVAILKGGRPATVNVEMNLMEMEMHYATDMNGSFGDTLEQDSSRNSDIDGRVTIPDNPSPEGQ